MSKQHIYRRDETQKAIEWIADGCPFEHKRDVPRQALGLFYNQIQHLIETYAERQSVVLKR